MTNDQNNSLQLFNTKHFLILQILIRFEFFVDVASVNFLLKINATRRQLKTLPDHLCHLPA